jgi:hypothetical protein
LPELRRSDLEAVREQLGREPEIPFTVVARCSAGGGHPLVIRNHPVDPEGHPFPTLYWLTCPAAVRTVSRVESEGWIGRLSERAPTDPEFGEALERAHREYAQERGLTVPEAEGWGGVAGTRVGVKCLHAHYAYHLSGGADPVGQWVAERIEPVHEERPGRVAAVDLGTNTIRLLAVEPAAGELVDLTRDTVITRIGKGVDRTGRLDPEALERTMRMLGRYCRRARALHAERIRVAATSAVRDASNREDLEQAVRQAAESDLEVLSGEQEAELTFLGATRGLDRPRPFLVLDIGGGSTEFVIGSDRPDAAVSTQMGSVRLTERHIRNDPPGAEERAALGRAIDDVLEEAEPAVAVARAKTLIAVAGTSTTVQAIALGLDAFDPEAIHGSELTIEAAERVLERLASMTTAQRAALPMMARGREDVIVAGATILVRVMRRWGFDRAVVSERDILDGLVMGMVQRGSPE